MQYKNTFGALPKAIGMQNQKCFHSTRHSTVLSFQGSMLSPFSTILNHFQTPFPITFNTASDVLSAEYVHMYTKQNLDIYISNNH